MALGFVECPRIKATFNELRVAAPSTLQPLYVYFEQQWLGSIPMKMWNVYDTDVRTNNACEGWHNRFNRAVDRHHPNIWHLLRVIMEEQAMTDVMRCQIAAGHNVCYEVPKYKAIRKRITTICDRYRAGTIDVIAYLDAISHNLKAWNTFFSLNDKFSFFHVFFCINLLLVNDRLVL